VIRKSYFADAEENSKAYENLLCRKISLKLN